MSDAYDRLPRQPATALTAGAREALREAAEVIALEEEVRQADLSRESARVWKAMMLAPSLQVFETLLTGESVPLDQLDAVWEKRFGMRER